MAEEIRETEVVEVTRTVEGVDDATVESVAEVTTEVTTTEVTAAEVAATEVAAAEEPAVDWEAAPVYEEPMVETTTETTTVAATAATTVDTTDVVTDTYYAPRGRWDFTDGQRIIIGVLLWLNILVAFAAYMLITGQLIV
jgi:hypothetical protein